MQSMQFTVPGKPQGKARARTFYNSGLGKHMSVTPENTVLYENLIKDRYLQKCQGVYISPGIPVILRITARFTPTKSTSKKKRIQMLGGELSPLKKPDIDNIIKVVADALNGVAYRDDTQIVKVDARKLYAESEGLDITIEEYKLGG